MDYYKTIADFPNDSIIEALIYALASAMPLFFPTILFSIWVFGTGASYFSILRTSGRKRFFQALTALSFACFILSLLFASLNSAVVEVFNGYWVGFYVLMTILSYLGLSFYK